MSNFKAFEIFADNKINDFVCLIWFTSMSTHLGSFYAERVKCLC